MATPKLPGRAAIDPHKMGLLLGMKRSAAITTDVEPTIPAVQTDGNAGYCLGRGDQGSFSPCTFFV
jgi:hypothetical protein